MHVLSLDASYIKSFSNYYHLLLSPTQLYCFGATCSRIHGEEQSEDKKKKKKGTPFYKNKSF